VDRGGRVVSARLGFWPAAALYGYAALVAVFVLAPIAVPLSISFSEAAFARWPPQGFSLQWYEKVLADDEFRTSFRFSLVLAVVVTAATLALGIPCAHGLAQRRFPGRAAIQGLVLSPLIFPILVSGMALLQFFSALGSRATFLHLVIGHVVVCLPYVVRTVTASLLLVDPNVEAAARTLGAGPLRAFWRVVLPQIRPGIFAGAVFAFITSFDDFAVSMWLADARNFPLPLQIYVFIQRFFDPSVAAISALMVLFAVALLLATERILGVSMRKVMAG
jgi:putative spermidine/putrescine transport system permease protein